MDVVDTPVGRIGVVISKDAWMTDVNDRFEAKNAQVLLQSEAFSDWAFVTSEWSPDVFKEGGFSFLQKNPSFVVNIDPSMTGNLFDLTFDGQSAVLGKKTKSDPGPLSAANAWISLSGIHGAPRLASMSPGRTSSGCTSCMAWALRA